MYFSSYNPSLHDVYLYGPGNSGMPIGLNTNCVLYDARESYKTVGLRVRRYGPDGLSLSGFTTGLPIEQWPNWWNSRIPLSWKLSPSYLSGCVHFMAGIPSDSIGGFVKTIVKQTGMTANYGWAFWHPNFDGYTYYTEFEGIYNCVATETEYPSPVYFSGSPEIPGFANGATFYLVSQADFGLMKFRSNANPSEATGPFVESVSIFSVLKDQNIDLKNYLVNQGTVILPVAQYTVYPENCYVWGGSDTVAPVSKIQLYIRTDELFENYPMGAVTISASVGLSGRFWVGDSSGFLLYKKNNKFYTIMHGLSVTSINGVEDALEGPAHAGTASLMLDYIANQTNIPTSYIKSLNSETQATMNNKLILLQNKLTQLIEKIAGVTI